MWVAESKTMLELLIAVFAAGVVVVGGGLGYARRSLGRHPPPYLVKPIARLIGTASTGSLAYRRAQNASSNQ